MQRKKKIQTKENRVYVFCFINEVYTNFPEFNQKHQQTIAVK